MSKLSRRQFIGLTGGAAAGAALLGVPGLRRLGASVARAQQPVTIRYIGRPGMTEPVEEQLKPWLEQTGHKLEIAQFGMQEISDKIMQSAATGTYLADVYQFPSQIRADVINAGALAEIPQAVLDAVQFDDILPVFARTLKWDGKVYALPYDGDIHYVNYRKDLFSDPELSARFKEAYGYDLPPDGASTWKQWRDIGEFFTGWDWNGNGETDDFGLSVLSNRGGFLWWGFFSRATAYAKHPDDPGFFLDLETGDARISNPGFVRALEEFAEETQKWAPPGGTNTDYGAMWGAIVGGRVVESYSWDGVAMDNAEGSVIQGKQGFSILPGSNEVYNSKTGQWDTFEDVSFAPFHAFGGWSFAVSTLSQPEVAQVAWEMLSYLAAPENSLWFVSHPTGASPYRESQLSNPAAFAEGLNITEETAQDYLDAARETLNHPNAVFDLAIPGFNQYRDALELGVSQALAGELTAQEALDQVAVAWDEVSERMGGKASQAALYAKTLGV
ncbi:MAG: extracellular solute-binding protein [Anaerolineae bacterium]|nr:extracellular solute-binding protein [Anaerolineae bacterium]